jgi:hypothetical protein
MSNDEIKKNTFNHKKELKTYNNSQKNDNQP